MPGLAMMLSLGAAGYHAQKPGATWVLMDANPDVAGCPSDEVREVGPGSTQSLEAPTGCEVEISVFPATGAPSLRPQQSGQYAVEAPEADGSEPLSVPLHLVLVQPAGGGEALAALRELVKTEVQLADDMLAEHRVGIRLVESAVTIVAPDDPLRKGILQECEGVAGSSLHHAGAVTVIYADASTWGFDGGGWSFYGYNCFASGARNLIFIAPEHADATLAHELGHALGLNHVPEVNERNLMRCCVFGPADKPVDQLALGQAYRANFHSDSWLNEGALRSGEVKKCQGKKLFHEDTASDWPCPRILLEGP